MKYVLVVGLLASPVLTSQSDAVVLYRTPTRNTTAPGGSLANSGWQYQGSFGAFLGTPIAPNYFITAAHVGGSGGINVGGTFYPIDTNFNVSGPGYSTQPGTDLRIWKINGTFANYAPLYDNAVDGSPVGKLLTVFGRGTQRGTEVFARNVGPPRDGAGTPKGGASEFELKGWRWGAEDGVQSWGTNNVRSLVNGGSGAGVLLQYSFDRIGGTNDESMLTGGDSGGGVFIQSASGAWKLAGINFATDGPWMTTSRGPAFNATLFDSGGLYRANPPTFITDTSLDIPTSSYSTSISANLAWIRSTAPLPAGAVSTPEPASVSLVMFGSAALLARRRRTI